MKSPSDDWPTELLGDIELVKGKGAHAVDGPAIAVAFKVPVKLTDATAPAPAQDAESPTIARQMFLMVIAITPQLAQRRARP